ncbi:MAG: hypothetical protein BGO37_15540 [Cellulomonas sp. 73-92]|uniref:DUF6049 family protein n=1 Tax=Cellulomonas sp. 73-92 TaxID=1895740 RepID=UPI00092A37C2|nr:DUF6049 family protein [Cellulomonas sp. 73-92]OJV80932.1 MAG: hypothetical protein BGO37_15540 [Cellulomonas sp. 73-92]
MTALRRRLAAAVLAVATVATPLLAAVLPVGAPGGPTSAAAASPRAAGAPAATPTAVLAPTAVAAPSAVTVQITSVTPTVLQPGQDLTVTATLVNRTSADLTNVVADLRLNRFRPLSRNELDGWATGSSGAVGTRVLNADPVSIPAGGQVTVQLTLPAALVRLSTLAGNWGPRGLAVEALSSGGTQLGIQRTFVLWMLNQVVPQVQVAVLAPVTATSSGAAALEQATAQGGRLDALAALATAEPDVEMAVDPALLTAASTGGPNATAWSQRLTAALARRDALALPWGDTDLGAVAHAGRPGLLTAAMSLAASSPLAGVNARTDVVWAPDGTLDKQTVDMVAAAGARAIVVGTTTLQPTTGAATALTTLDAGHGTLAALVPDGLLTDLLAAPDDVQPGATTATTVQRLLAELAVLAHDGSARPHDVLIAPGRGWTPDATLATALLDALHTSPWSRLVPVSALLGAEDQGTARATLPASAVDPSELSPGDVRALADARSATTAFAHAIGDGGPLTAGLDQTVLAPLGVAWRADTAGRDVLVKKALAGTTATRTGLSLTGPPSLSIISASAPVRFVVHNSLSVPATVSVAVDPHKACLRSVRSDPVTAPAGTDTAVVVDLEAIANCDVTVDATLVGNDGTAVSGAIGFAARVAPTIENVFTVVVGVLLAIGLVLGIIRTARRGQSSRRGNRLSPEADPDDEAHDEASAAPDGTGHDDAASHPPGDVHEDTADAAGAAHGEPAVEPHDTARDEPVADRAVEAAPEPDAGA